MSSSSSPYVVLGTGLTGLVIWYNLIKKWVSWSDISFIDIAEKPWWLLWLCEINWQAIEWTYHHFFRSDKELIQLANDLWVRDCLQWFNSSTAIYEHNTLYPFMTPKDILSFKPLSFFNRVRLGIVVLFLQYFSHYQVFEQYTAYERCKIFFWHRVTEVIRLPLLKGKFHHYFKKVSMSWLWHRLWVRGKSKNTWDLVEKLWYFVGWCHVLINTLVGELTSKGVTFHFSTTITSIQEERLIDSNNKEYAFKKLFCTIPSYIFANLAKQSLSCEYYKHLNSIEYIGEVNMLFSSPQSLSTYYRTNINTSDSPFLVFIQHTNLVGTKYYKWQNVYYLGKYVPHDHEYMKHPEKFREDSLIYLKKMFPSFEINLIDQEYTFSFRNAQHIVDIAYKDKIPSVNTELEHVYLVNFSQLYPEDRWLNQSVKQANEVVNSLFHNK